MPTHLFSTYSTAENRVTGSFLAVLRSLAMDRAERLLGAVMGDDRFELVRFVDQPASLPGAGVPDGEIRASCQLLLEVKIKRNTVDAEQLRRHLANLAPGHDHRVLLVLTPDGVEPRAIADVGDERVRWVSFAALNQAITELLGDASEVISEREAFLLRELQVMFNREGLVGVENEVLVVAARKAWPEYLDYGVYVCQPHRTFRPVQRIAFYYDRAIQPRVALIKSVEDDVAFSEDMREGPLGTLISSMLEGTPRQAGERFKVFWLSGHDDAETLTLPAAVANDLPSAFVQGQRYVPLAALKHAKATSDLVT